VEKQVVIESPGGTFGAYISRPTTLSAPVVVVLQELFGVNADIRATCDELAAQGYIAIAPDLFWRQEQRLRLFWRNSSFCSLCRSSSVDDYSTCRRLITKDWKSGMRTFVAGLSRGPVSTRSSNN
jgi:hypothetical protein